MIPSRTRHRGGGPEVQAPRWEGGQSYKLQWIIINVRLGAAPIVRWQRRENISSSYTDVMPLSLAASNCGAAEGHQLDPQR